MSSWQSHLWSGYNYGAFQDSDSGPIAQFMQFLAPMRTPSKKLSVGTLWRPPPLEHPGSLNAAFVYRTFSFDDDIEQLKGLDDDTVLHRIVNQNQECMRQSLNDGLSFILSLFPDCFASPNFQRTMGKWDYERSRLIILFMGNSLRWSIFTNPRRDCPFCSDSLHSAHFFLCPNFVTNVLIVPWMEVLRRGRAGEWDEFKDAILGALKAWALASDRVRPEVRALVS